MVMGVPFSLTLFETGLNRILLQCTGNWAECAELYTDFTKNSRCVGMTVKRQGSSGLGRVCVGGAGTARGERDKEQGESNAVSNHRWLRLPTEN
jgi:hypothetical protein